MNYFIEGLQGSGKTTLAERLAQMHPDHRVFHEGDYSPVELAWCAYVEEKEYEEIPERYRDLSSAIREKTHEEGDHRIICYTKVRTENRDFYRDLERYEIYNGRVPLSKLEEIILRRYRNYEGDRGIFECSLLQNTVEDMILFHERSDEEILSFSRKVSKALADRDIRILYLKSEDIEGNIARVRKERIDAQGREVWFEAVCDYFDHSPYAVKNSLSGERDLFDHLKHRQELELRICEEVFADCYTILRSKDHDLMKTDL